MDNLLLMSSLMIPAVDLLLMKLFYLISLMALFAIVALMNSALITQEMMSSKMRKELMPGFSASSFLKVVLQLVPAMLP